MRKEKIVDIPGAYHEDDNRDGGKRFVIVEMAAYDLEWFAIRAFQALGSSGIQVPQDIVESGAIGLFVVAYQAFMGSTSDQIKTLKDEMMQCVFYTPSTDVRMPWNPQLVEEIETLKVLREAWLKLHTGFTLAELLLSLQKSISATMLKRKRSRTTSTSQDQLEP